MCELVERGGEGCLLELGARLRRFAVDEKSLEETRRGFQLGIFLDRQPRLAARHRVALARVLDGGVEQHMQRQARAAASCALAASSREHPAGHRARHGERGERPARRNFVMAGIAIELRAWLSPRRGQRP